MKYLWIVLLAVFIQGECRRSHSDDEGGEVTTNCVNKDVDQYLDDVLDKVRHELPDPLRLPPRSSIVELSDGNLWGLSDIKRVGSAEVICDGDKVTIKATLTSDEIKGRYTWTQERRNKSPREGYVVIISDDFRAKIEMVVEKVEGQPTHPQLRKFVILRLKDAKIEITGMSYVTWALSEVSTLMSGIFQRAIAAVVEDPIKEGLQRQFRELNLD